MRCGVGSGSAAVLAAALAVAINLGQRWERALVIEPVDGVVLYAASSEDETSTSNGATQRFDRLPNALAASYSFTNFNRDRLNIDYSLGKAAYAAYEAGFGYYKKDVAEIDAWNRNARDGAYKYAVKSHKSQAQLDAALAALDREREQRVKAYMTSRGFRMLPRNVVTVDVPGVVKKNGPLLNSVAQAFERVSDRRHYDSETLIGAATSLVQTALIYKIPPDIEADGRHTGGILQPATTLLKGWGDCDTKSALLASLLSNWPQMRMVGVSVPGHYLMGVLRIPNQGDAFVEHEGLQYVLIEPAGPAWLPPGQVAQTTIPLLESNDGFRIDPFF